jgi:hypothetical protein
LIPSRFSQARDARENIETESAIFNESWSWSEKEVQLKINSRCEFNIREAEFTTI